MATEGKIFAKVGRKKRKKTTVFEKFGVAPAGGCSSCVAATTGASAIARGSVASRGIGALGAKRVGITQPAQKVARATGIIKPSCELGKKRAEA